ncbi:MAG: hypothetical protein M0Q43_09400 [Methanothrix sp.]|jgi:hypothetical protein|nr:hypothetical protein [Methanothrix sp.]
MSIDSDLKKFYSDTFRHIDLSIKAIEGSNVMPKEEADCFIQVLTVFRRLVESGFNMKSNTMGHCLCVILSKVALTFLSQPGHKSALEFMYAVSFNCDIFGDEEGRKILADVRLAAMPTHQGGMQ